MPRTQRKQIETGVYHIMLRGNERKNIFSDEEDKQRMIDTLIKLHNEGGFKLYAYCIMDNHLHFAVEEETEGIARIVKRVGTSYAYYYNFKHQRVGHVFQDRFKSEGIKDDAQLLEVIRYIHNNPVKAEMVGSVEKYPWNSYNAYTGKKQMGREKALFLSDVEDVLQMFSMDHDKAVKLFIAFTKERTEKKFLDMDYMKTGKDDIDFQNRVHKVLAVKGLKPETVKEDRILMEQVVRELKFEHGIAGRQIARSLGINRNVVQRINKNEA